MIFSSPKAMLQKQVPARTIKCQRCLNVCEHKAYGYLVGPTLGFIWLPQELHIGFKEFYYVCSICGFKNEKISQEKMRLFK